MPTITPNGIVLAHDDHDLQPAHLIFIDDALADWDGSFLLRVLELPVHCPNLLCSLYGPSVGDEPVTEDQVTYEKRNNRPGPSRLIDAPSRPARNMVVCGMRVEDGTLMLFTAYGTQATTPSPREWWDSGMKPQEAIEAATFWSQHALVKGGE
tara:strand:- start:36 stop:494 length:459 start_codon:yes stop_codon:yes gene_type:complete